MPDEKKQDAATAWDATQWHEVIKGDTLSKIAQTRSASRNRPRMPVSPSAADASPVR